MPQSFRTCLTVIITFTNLLHADALHVAASETGVTAATDFQWRMRTQTRVGNPAESRWQRDIREETWSAESTAFIVCDVWDKHHCLNAVRRLEEFAPRLNAVLQEARRRGAVIIHSPSDCMAANEGHPSRMRAQQTPTAAHVPPDTPHWCSRIPAEELAVYPIDQSDGGQDDDPTEHAAWAAELTALGRNPGMPWKAQSSLIEVDSQQDYISDRGDEVWNILESRGIRNVVLTGVHTNMCVLGRPFGLRQMVRNGRHVVLMRDMTDSMYNPQSWPYVDHFTGNDLIISHVERYVCPTVTSDQVLGGIPFRSKSDLRTDMDIMQIPTGSQTPESLKSQWSVVKLPGTWSDVIGSRIRPEAAGIWYRCTLRLSDTWLGGQDAAVTLIPPEHSHVSAWLNGNPLTATDTAAVKEPQKSTRLSATAIRFTLPASQIAMNDANLFVVQIQPRVADDQLMQPPVLSSGSSTFSLAGRWQVRQGDDASFSNIPLPSRFGTSTDIIFEP